MKNIKTLSIAILLVTFCIGANANNNSMSNRKNIAESLEIIMNTPEIFIEESEEEIQLENWMIKPNIWKSTVTNDKITTEDKINLKDWMFDFNVENENLTDQEEDLALEDWMTRF